MADRVCGFGRVNHPHRQLLGGTKRLPRTHENPTVTFTPVAFSSPVTFSSPPLDSFGL